MKSYRARKLLADRRGAAMVEYAVLLFFVMVVGAVAYTKVGKEVRQAGDMTWAQFHP